MNIAGVDVSKVDDALFKKEKKAKSAGESKFFAENKVNKQKFRDFSLIFHWI